MIFSCAVLIIVHHHVEGPVQTVLNLPVATDQRSCSLTGALLDRLTHHVNILEMNGESYRLSQSRARLTTAGK